MNMKRLATLALSSALALGFMAPPAFAWGPGGPGPGWGPPGPPGPPPPPPGPGPRDHGWYDRGYRDADRERYWRDRDRERDRRDARRAYDRGYRDGYRTGPDVVYYRPGPPRWARGQRYYGPNYVVYDYDRYQVRRPPYGYRWVRDDTGNLLMVAIATGIIADLVLSGR
ncbi:MAG: RcnB family protein [Xanthomonas sp.]